MKPNLYCFFALIAFLILPDIVKASFFNDFPRSWKGDTALFKFYPTEQILNLSAPEEAGEAFVFKGSSAIEDACWEMDIHLDFNPSSANYLRIYLAIDGDTDFQNGFFLVAGTTKDNVSLWERQHGKDRLLIEGSEDRLDSDPAVVSIRAGRGKGGYWKLEIDTGNGWHVEGSTQSEFGFAPSFFGLSCHYTKTRCDKFFIGPVSVSGQVYRDTIPPVIEHMEVINGHNLLFSFSEPVVPEKCSPVIRVDSREVAVDSFLLNENFTKATVILNKRLPDTGRGQITFGGMCDANGAVMIDTTFAFSFMAPDINELFATGYQCLRICFNQDMPDSLLFQKSFQSETTGFRVNEIRHFGDFCYELILDQKMSDATEVEIYVENLFNPEGDTIPAGPYSVYYHEAGDHDLVITEIMHDPSPMAMMPGVEYLELFNRSDFPVDLKNMTLHVKDRSMTLPEYMVFPDEYVVLYGDETIRFANGLSLDRWLALTNSGGEIVLRSPSGQVVTALRYPAKMEGKSYKQQGGWSMEVVDPDNLSGNFQNWAYCQNGKGGTPGADNSVRGPNPDVIPPEIADAWLENDSVLVLDFGEPLYNPTHLNNLTELVFSGAEIEALALDSVFRDLLYIKFSTKLVPHKVEILEVSDRCSDLAGNLYDGPPAFPFGRPGRIDSLDIVINELLFDPPSFGGDYVELYNRSQRIAALDSLCLARNSGSGEPEALIRLSHRIRWFLPGWHLCFAADPKWVSQQYNVEQPYLLKALPNLPNYVRDGGTVFLTQKNGVSIDRFDFSPELHYDLLSDTKSVALERTQHEAPPNHPMTWHSASSEANYGTPTGSNSQLIEFEKPASATLFSLSPEIFTPDLDGTDDQLIISYSFKEPGQKGTFIVYDAEGRQVRQLVNNQTLSTSGQLTWDGTDDDHRRASPGIYIVWARIFNLKGNVKAYKESCVLGICDY
jgi:hypothetical protein